MNISKNHPDVAMDYEELAKEVFECDRFGDPWEYADADRYNAHFAPDPDNQATIILNTIIDIALWKYKKIDSLAPILIEMKNRVQKMKSQEEAITIIHDTIDALNKYA